MTQATIEGQGTQSKGMTYGGIALSAVPCLMLLASGAMKLAQPPKMVEQFGHLGFNPNLLLPIGIAELLSVALYAIPQTAVLGAILITGYMGGAMVTHIRVGEPWVVQFLIGAVAWGGLYLRDPRVRALLPLRR